MYSVFDGREPGLCLKAFSAAFVNGLVVEIHFLIVTCPPTAIVIDFVVIPRSGMLRRGTVFFLHLCFFCIYAFSKKQSRYRLPRLQRNLFLSLPTSNMLLYFVNRPTGIKILTFGDYSLSKISLKLEGICKHLCRNHNHNPK